MPKKKLENRQLSDSNILPGTFTTNKLYYSLQYTIYEFLILAKYNDNLFNNIIVLMYINNKLYIDYNFIKIGDLIITDNCDFYFKVLKTIKTNNLIELTDHEKKILDINEKSKIIK